MEADELRRRLERIAAATASAFGIPDPSWWVGQDAAERRAMDDLRAGRLWWRGARHAAVNGLEALDSGDMEMAMVCWREANDLERAALVSRIEPADIEFLSRGASARGRRADNAARDAALAAAVARHQARGLGAKAARSAAIAEDPDLKAAFAGISDSALAKAVRRARAGL